MREVLTYYLTRLNQIEYYDITQLAIQMQILADDLFDEFEIESEELEFAHDCMDNRVKQLTRKINKKTEELIDEAVINLPKRS